MRNFIIALLFILTGCSQKGNVASPSVVHDTVEVPVPTKVICDTIYVPQIEYDTIVISRNDSLVRRLNAANQKIARVDFYLRIVERNPTQIKFLVGWLRRPVPKKK